MTTGYYDKPIVKPHVWHDAIGWYFFTGGLAGASSTLAVAAELSGQPRLARHARRASMLGLAPSPGFLIYDLGRPERFANMLRVFKPTSPMSVGSWLLAVYGPAAGAAWALGELGWVPRTRRLLGLTAGVFGPAIATYTAVLVSDTATPVWHEAKDELPFVFASSAAASAGGVTSALAALAGPSERSARFLAVAGALAELGAAAVMKQRLGDLDVYGRDPATRRYDRAAQAFSVVGVVGLLAGRGRRLPTIAAGLATAAGSFCERMAVLRAGIASANDPSAVLNTRNFVV